MKKILCWLSISNFHYDDFIYSGLITLGKEKSKKKNVLMFSLLRIFSVVIKKIKLCPAGYISRYLLEDIVVFFPALRKSRSQMGFVLLNLVRSICFLLCQIQILYGVLITNLKKREPRLLDGRYFWMLASINMQLWGNFRNGTDSGRGNYVLGNRRLTCSQWFFVCRKNLSPYF